MLQIFGMENHFFNILEKKESTILSYLCTLIKV